MFAPTGLINAVNAMREASVVNGSIFHQYVPAMTPESDISVLGTPILKYRAVQNDFMNNLINVLVEQRVNYRVFNNKLRVLMGDRMPLGYAGQEIYINPATAEKYNPNDLMGLLQKYEADIKTQYYNINVDEQYKVTVTRHDLAKAFTSWNALDDFVNGVVQSLYNAMYIHDYRYSKLLVTNAYRNYTTPIMQIEGVTTEEQAKTFLTQARSMFLNFDEPSTEYNGWSVAGDGTPVTTWSENERKVLLIRNDILAYLDVNVLAAAFHIDSAKLMGRVIGVDNFDAYDDQGNKTFDGSAIIALLADETWFRIREVDTQMDMFYNPNARTWTYFLNNTKMFSQNIFSNGVIFATALPTITPKSISLDPKVVNISVGGDEVVTTSIFPAEATTTMTYNSTNEEAFTVSKDATDEKKVTVTGVAAGSGLLVATTANGISEQIQVNVTAAAARSAKRTVKTQPEPESNPETK